MSPISARGFAVASATAVTTVGAVMGVAQGDALHSVDDAQATGGSTLLADLPVGEQVEVQTASLSQQADVQAIAADATAKKTAEEAARKQAAKDAVAKQQAAADKAKAEKEAKEAKERAETKAETTTQSASGNATFVQQGSYSTSEVQAIARQIIPGGQFQCFSNIVEHESGWNYKAVNPSSGAYGLVQAYPGSKMSSAGADWRTNPATQIKWGLNYMNERYGSPCGAWDYWQANSSY
ncbi:aggregation-promoting factor C-terminal-like domain-containing protein [Streptomyces humidus]|uniref:aggregation-promoting factor C-terminal-like domain-containing protein n=1 Tax=Streptomyces humidus TaxID=52259 RepID=UPI00332A96DF